MNTQTFLLFVAMLLFGTFNTFVNLKSNNAALKLWTLGFIYQSCFGMLILMLTSLISLFV